MLTYLISYLILSQILMLIFLQVNKEEITEQYLESEKKRATEPTQWWLNIYIFVHLIKAPVLAPMIFLLILGNGGKLIK
jgi:hypothetical protein